MGSEKRGKWCENPPHHFSLCFQRLFCGLECYELAKIHLFCGILCYSHQLLSFGNLQNLLSPPKFQSPLPCQHEHEPESPHVRRKQPYGCCYCRKFNFLAPSILVGCQKLSVTLVFKYPTNSCRHWIRIPMCTLSCTNVFGHRVPSPVMSVSVHFSSATLYKGFALLWWFWSNPFFVSQKYCRSARRPQLVLV